MKKTEMTVLERAIYIIGGVLIIAAAIKVVWSTCQFLMKFLQKRKEDII